jgi:hypothetical protein
MSAPPGAAHMLPCLSNPILMLLRSMLPSLPPWVRFVVTSRSCEESPHVAR